MTTSNFSVTSTPQPLEVLIIGAGFSGLCAAIKLRERGITSFRIVDKADDIGGTWHYNTYPGAACDIPSHLYCFSFAPNPGWSRHYAPHHEIKSYIKKCADDFGIMPHIHLAREVVTLGFEESTGQWHTGFRDGEVLKSRFVINATGGLHKPVIPAFPGASLFQGPQMHTAQWDASVNLDNRRIAIIGSAASAIQATPPLAQRAADLFVFQRTPNFILPRHDKPYKGWHKKLFRYFPFLIQLYRTAIFLRLEILLFPLIRKETKLRQRAEAGVATLIRDVVKDQGLHDILTPDYKMGCKRILISDDFYGTLNEQNVTLITDPIAQLGKTHIELQSGTQIPVDVIVYATGFDLAGHLRHLSVTGREGVELNTVWADREEAYMGACVAGFPNYFFITGPNTGVGTTSVVFMIEQQVHFLMQLLGRAQAGETVEIRQDAQDAYNQKIQADLQETVWASGCKSWYRKEDGTISTLYPYDGRSYRKQMRRPQWEDFIFATTDHA